MEKVKRSTSLFPPLPKPAFRRQETKNWNLSAEGQEVMTELERRSRYYRRMRNKICGAILENEESITATKNKAEMIDDIKDYCIACEQRISLQPIKRENSGSKVEYSLEKRDNLKQCVCILCKKVLTPTPQGLKKLFADSNLSHRKNLSNRGEQVSNYPGFRVKHNEELMKDFRISSLDYDSRLVSPAVPPIEQHIPPKEVMMRSEKKCQIWLTKNHEYFKEL